MVTGVKFGRVGGVFDGDRVQGINFQRRVALLTELKEGYMDAKPACSLSAPLRGQTMTHLQPSKILLYKLFIAWSPYCKVIMSSIFTSLHTYSQFSQYIFTRNKRQRVKQNSQTRPVASV
jgi:hypothetical protein